MGRASIQRGIRQLHSDNVQINAEGRLSEETISLAQELDIPHAITPAVEDEGNIQPEEGITPPLFMFSQQPVCECPK